MSELMLKRGVLGRGAISVRGWVAMMMAVAAAGPAQSWGQTGENKIETNVDLPMMPAISPDGKTAAFSWRGDVWTVSTAGGLANRVTTSVYDDVSPAFSPDGKRLGFVSTRNGGANLFTINLDGTGLKQVTYGDRPMLLTQWTSGGTKSAADEKLMVSGALDPMPFMSPKGYQVSPDGGDITEVYKAFGSVPVVSPDGKRILLGRGVSPWERRGYRGSQNRDVWMYEKATGKYTRLTAFDGNDGKAKWLDDETVVFVSDRQNNTYNLYSLKVGASDETAKAITNLTGNGVDDFDVSPETGKIIYSSWDRLYTLDGKSGGAPVAVAVRASEEEGDRVRFQSVAGTVSEAVLSPDGKAMAIISYGELYVRGTDAKSPTRRVTGAMGGRKREVNWSADGQRILFVCDVDGKDAIYSAGVKLTRTELKKKTEDATADKTSEPSEETKETTAATTSPTTQPGATPPRVTPPPNPEMEADVDPDQARRMLPPGMMPAGAGAPGMTAGMPSGMSAAPTSEPSRWADAMSFTVIKVFNSPANDRRPTPSPDGKVLAFLRDRGTLMIHDKATNKIRKLAENFDDFDFRFSPDSKYIAYATDDRNNNSDIWVVPTDGSEKPVNITRHPGADFAPRWSADGKILAFLSNRAGTGDETAVYSVYLDKSLEDLAGPELDAYYRDASTAARRRTPPATRPTSQPTTMSRASTRPTLKQADLEDAYLRIRRWTNVRGSIMDLELAPAGDRIYFVGPQGTQRALFTQTREGPESRIANGVNIQNMSLTGDSIAAVESAQGGPTPASSEGGARPGGARACVIRLPGGETEYYDPSDRLKVDLQKLSEQKFLEASRVMSTVFYNADMNGTDWKALTEKYLPLARNARTATEFDFVANRFVGELNASHLGVSSPSTTSPLVQPVGKLGVGTARLDNGLEVTDVLPEGPADKGKMKLKKGDVITAIDFTPIGPKDTLDKMLSGKLGVEVVVSVLRDGKNLDLLVTPASFAALQDLAYDRWREAKLEEVTKLSGGKLGYIHIQGMNQASLETYKRDLYAACDGRQAMIVDVRWNGGGSTADLLLTSFMSPYHAYTVPRKAPTVVDSYPSDRLYIPRFIGPMDMLCNERSFSNAEIISHAFKTLKRGTLVGNQTAGGVISTGGVTLLDGTSVRTPNRGWYTPDGKNMELNGALPDILVVQTPDDEVSGNDPQLKAAVDDLLKRVK